MRFEGAADPVGLTSLDPHETTVGPQTGLPGGMELDDDGLDVAFRHSGWLADRNRVILALVAAEVAPARVARFRACGSNAWVQRARDDPERVRISSSYCHDRFCVPCGTHRGSCIARRLRAYLAGQPARFVTLTLASDGLDLASRLTRLLHAFRRLRGRKWWRDRVSGGCATVEIKWSVRSAHWHPHLHLLLRSKYLDQSQLALQWHACTGDSYIVDVRLVKDAGEACSYVAKYVAKPASPSVYRDPDRLQEMIRALHGSRLLLTYGDCTIPDDPDRDDPTEWVPIARLTDVILDSRAGVPTAIALLTLLEARRPCHRSNKSPPPCTP